MTRQIKFLQRAGFFHIVNRITELELPHRLNSVNQFLTDLGLPGRLTDSGLWEVDHFAAALLTGDDEQVGGNSADVSIIASHAFVATSFSAATNPPSPEERRILMDVFAEQASWASAKLGHPIRRHSEDKPKIAWSLSTGCELELQVGRWVRLELNSPLRVKLLQAPPLSEQDLQRL